jgi:hypothetical protein
LVVDDELDDELDVLDELELVVVGAVVVVVGVVVVVVRDVVVVGGFVVVVVVVVVVGEGRRYGPSQPQRISIGPPSGCPAISGTASMALRNCCQPSHAEIPVVGQPPRTCRHAEVWTDMPPKVKVTPNDLARAAINAHCLESEPV